MLVDDKGNEYEGGDKTLDVASSYLNELRAEGFDDPISNLSESKTSITLDLSFVDDAPSYDIESGGVGINEERKEESMVALGVVVLMEDHMQSSKVNRGAYLGGIKTENNEINIGEKTNGVIETRKIKEPEYDADGNLTNTPGVTQSPREKKEAEFKAKIENKLDISNNQPSENGNDNDGDSIPLGRGIQLVSPCKKIDGGAPVFEDKKKKSN